MAETRTWLIIILGGYLLILLGVGFWARREATGMAGYYVAGKKLPSWVIAFSSNATGESAWLLLGLTGVGYLMGIHALWIVLGEALGVAIAWVFVARPFKLMTDRYDSITVPDFLESRFGDRRQILRRIAAVVILSMVVAYTAAQLTASGKAFTAFLDLDYATGVIIGAVVVLLYTVFGGFKAVAYTDALQGLLMLGCLVALPIVGIVAVGGFGEMIARLGAEDPTLLLPMGSLGLTTAGVISAVSFAGVGLAFLGVPQLLGRFIAAKSEREIAPAGLIAVVCILLFDVGAVFAGMAGRVLYPGLADPEVIMPTMSTGLFPAVFAGLFLVTVLAAIMSTADSLLILASSAVVRDVVQKIYRPAMADERLARIARWTTLILGLAALAVALGEVRVVFWFVLFAWSGLASAFVPVVLCALFWRRTTLAGAIAGMITGFLVVLAWVLVFKSHFHDLYEMIPGVAAGLLATIVVSLMGRPDAARVAELDAVHRQLGGVFRRHR